MSGAVRSGVGRLNVPDPTFVLIWESLCIGVFQYIDYCRSVPMAMRRAERKQLDHEDPEVVARFFHGLADPTRVEILQFLLAGPKTAGGIGRPWGLHQASVSSHLTRLRFCGFVRGHPGGANRR